MSVLSTTKVPSAAEVKTLADDARKARVTKLLALERDKPNYKKCWDVFNDAILCAAENHTDVCVIEKCILKLNQLAFVELQLKGWWFIPWECGFRRVYQYQQKKLRFLPFISYRAKVEVGKAYTIKFKPLEKREDGKVPQCTYFEFDEKWNPN
jgi:hypothetical protein